MKNTVLILLLILALVSCKKLDPNKYDKIKASQWLLGKWENNSDLGNLSETWKKENDSTYNGQSFFIKSKDTLHFEEIQLKQKGETLFYISAIKGQNKEAAIPFKLVVETDKKIAKTSNKLVFVNTKNDYPQKINYSRITKDSFLIEISGIQQGKPSSDKYAMKRSK